MNKYMLKKIICAVMASVILVVSAGCSGSKTSENNTSESSESKSSSESSQSSSSETSSSTTTDATTNDKLVALTFDDGPYSPVTEKILDVLEKYNAKATFFVVGNRVATYSSSVKRAYEMGCEIGSHSYSHKNLTKLNAAAIVEEIDKSNDAISKITGHNITVVRPPEGAVNDMVRATVKYPLVMWSVDSLDWKYRDETKDYNGIMKSVFDGSIILMHDLYPASAATVEKLVPALMSEGYKFVTFSELMELRGVQVESGAKYYSAKPKPVTTTAQSSTSQTATVNSTSK
jgi:peptidoglycan/xylan/chitin deacetylase (PgdA/CDA1 family)